jgi:hypothetical protein
MPTTNDKRKTPESQEFGLRKGWRVEGGGWRVESGGWRVEGGEWGGWDVLADTAASGNTAKYGDYHKRIVISDSP